MKSKLIFKILREVLFKVWLLCYGLVVLCFFIALVSKFTSPEIKNLSWDNFAVIGGVLFGFLIVNLFALKRRAKNKEHNS